MKANYRIGLFIFIFVIIYLFYNSITYSQVKAPDETDYTAEELSLADNKISNTDCYYLYDKNGYIVVYLSDKKTLFEYTNISTENLPKELIAEIKNGKQLNSIEELYGFLENYSS